MATKASQVKCTVCLESFKDPKVLPCCHSFCLKCLKGIVKKAKDKTNLKCPQCRTEHKIPPNGTKGFLNDYTIPPQESKGASKTPGQPLCQQCGGKNKAVAYCHACAHLGTECLDIHKRLKIFETHKVTSGVKTAWAESTVDTQHTKTYYCTIHPEEALKLYCKTCKTLACLLCFVSSHNGHDIGSIDKQARKEVQQNVTSLIQQSDSMLKSFRVSLQKINAVEKKKTAASAPHKSKINKRIDSLIAKFEKKRKELITEADESVNTELKELWEEKEHHETAIVSLQGALDFARRSLHCDDTELLALCSQVTTRLEALNSTKLECPTAEKLKNTKVVFNEGKQVSYISDFAGSIHIEDNNPTIEIIADDIPDNYYCEGNTVYFRVTLKIIKKDGQMVKQPAFALTATVSEPSGSRNDCSVQKRGTLGLGNKWTVSFYPKERGKHSITLRASATGLGLGSREITQETSVQCNIQDQYGYYGRY